VAPLVGGLLADYAGYRVVFALAGLVSLLSAVVLVGRVRDPRQATRSVDSAASS